MAQLDFRSEKTLPPVSGAADSASWYNASTQHAGSRIHSGVCPGTLGELLQGPCMHEGELHIGLITLPVRQYSWMHFLPGQEGDPTRDLAGKRKCRRVIDAYLDLHRLVLPPGRWMHASELPEGRGMASSTADLVATIRCLDSLFERATPISRIADLLREIERSDAVFLDSPAVYLSGRQEIWQRLPGNVSFHACYIDEGDAVDTQQVTPQLMRWYAAQWPAYRANLAQAMDAFGRGDRAAIASCATVSATLAQGVIRKRHFNTLMAERERFGADGVVVAHTGSLIGYLFLQAPGIERMGALSAFFLGLGHQCRFVETGF